MKIIDSGSSPHILGDNITIAANSYLVLCVDGGTSDPGKTCVATGTGSNNGMGIATAGEVLALCSPESSPTNGTCPGGTVIDSIPSLGAATAGKSKALDVTKLNATDKDTVANWSDATNTYDNTYNNMGTPGFANNGTSSVYTIGSTVSGLTSGTLVLQNNSGDNKSLTADGAYTFTTQVTTYNVTVLTQPGGTLVCTVSNGSGTATATVTNVNVTCSNVTLASMGELALNEVHSNSGGPNGADYIEIYNKASGERNFGSGTWYLADEGIIATPASYYELTGTISANGFRLLEQSQPGSFTFGLGSGDAVYLIYKSGSFYYIVDSIVWTTHVQPAQRATNGTGAWQSGGTTTAGTTNTGNGTAITYANPTDLVLNEIHSNNGSVAGAPYVGGRDFIEVFNKGAGTFDLSTAGSYFILDNDFDTATLTNLYDLSGLGGTVAVGGVKAFENTTHFIFGLGANDKAYLLLKKGTTYLILDSHSWTAHVASACRNPNGTGAFAACTTTFNALN